MNAVPQCAASLRPDKSLWLVVQLTQKTVWQQGVVVVGYSNELRRAGRAVEVERVAVLPYCTCSSALDCLRQSPNP